MAAISPFEIILDAQVVLCNSPEWMEQGYPRPVHMAHDVLERARLHLGIRAIEGYSGKPSCTDELAALLQGSPDGETPQADEKPGPDYELQGKEF